MASVTKLYRYGRALIALSLRDRHTLKEIGIIIGSSRNPDKPIRRERARQLVNLGNRINNFWLNKPKNKESENVD